MAVAAVGAVAVGASAYSASQQGDAAEEAAETQAASSEAGIAEERRQFDKIVELLSPYVSAGTGAIGQQEAILGLKGPEAQKAAISGIEQSPYFQSQVRQGETGILQNASATGGLRGGNVQGALAQFRPALLNQLIQQQYGQLGGLSQMGQASAAQQAAAGQQAGSNISDLYAQQGAAIAGGQLARGNAYAGTSNTIGQLAGIYIGSQF